MRGSVAVELPGREKNHYQPAEHKDLEIVEEIRRGYEEVVH